MNIDCCSRKKKIKKKIIKAGERGRETERLMK